MQTDFKPCIQQLYTLFSSGAPPQTLIGCPCCTTTLTQTKWHQNDVALIDASSISDYTFKAMSTYGTVENFRYFLPRILELLASQQLQIDRSLVWSKLKYGQWTSWPIREVAAIRQFLEVYWNNHLMQTTDFDRDTLLELYDLTKNIKWMLELWSLDYKSPAFKKTLQLVVDYASPNGFKKSDWLIEEADLNILNQWLSKNSVSWEEALSYYEAVDPLMAELIIAAIYAYTL